jgi:hypothetical protein
MPTASPDAFFRGNPRRAATQRHRHKIIPEGRLSRHTHRDAINQRLLDAPARQRGITVTLRPMPWGLATVTFWEGLLRISAAARGQNYHH